MTAPRLPVGGHRLEVTGWASLTVSTVVLAIGYVLDREWIRAALWVAAFGIAVRGLRRVFRRGPTTADERRRAVSRAAALEWPAERLLGLARDRGVDVGTRDDQIALIKALRTADPRLSLLDAKNLVDGLDTRDPGGNPLSGGPTSS
ncbi:hypothetical protein ACFEMC_20815 [Kineococcus sp. DHX-1]|uniref:hypothetical protein n=1 Tax=Kineococcus sp. DHX-1 TaxID=3349638 RepID=UPI0036D22956